MISIVVAMDRNRGIGKTGGLPWRLSTDMRFFRDLTTCPEPALVELQYGLVPGVHHGQGGAGRAADFPPPSVDHRNAVLMGRKTWDSLPAAFRPLPARLNGVLSRQVLPGEKKDHRVWTSLSKAVAELQGEPGIGGIFIIGGAQLYSEALTLPGCRRIYLTEIDADFLCDVFFPEIPSGFHEVAASDPIEESGVRYRFRLLQRRCPELACGEPAESVEGVGE